jgi:hypothetical protein
VKKWGRFCDGLGSNIMVQYSVADQITAREYGDPGVIFEQ